jgi:thiol-disulfide isomerase/thioredoxin
MKSWILASLVFSFFTAAWADTAPLLKELKFDSLNQAAPDFIFADASGKPIHLNDGGGVPTILHLWATWCVPCQKEMPELVKFAKSLPDQNFKLLIVAVDDETKREQVARDLKNLNLDLPAYVVRKSDASKKIVARVSGSRDWRNVSPEKFDRLISGLKKGT